MALSSGTKFGHYKILSELGKGGMGEVYLAHDTRLNRQVALKVLPADLINNRERLHRFEQEARSASALNHPNIITIHEIGTESDTDFIAMEFIEGLTLRRKLRTTRLEIGESLNIASQIAAALDAAHRSGIVHRDIKPENLMSREDGLVKVLDFGLAKLAQKSTAGIDSQAATRVHVKTEAGVILGTVAYMSPEQARGLPVDARTDIFSLGVVLYEMLTGQLPFTGDSTSDVIASILRSEPQPPGKFNQDAPTELDRIVTKTLQKDREERYQTAKDLLVDLKHLKKQIDVRTEIEHTASANKQIDNENATQILAARQTSNVKYAASKINHKGGFVGVLSVLLLAAIGIGYWFSVNRSATATPIESIAVMPFVNESGNTDVEYLSDGMTETLISSLSQIPKLNVKARSSVFRYKDKETNAQTIGKELNVQAILNGSVVQRGNNLALHIELVDVNTEIALWSADYNSPMANLVSLQSEITRDVAQKLKIKLSGADERKLAKNYTENAEAYQEYLKGRYYSTKFTEDGLKKSVEHFQRAIEFDPNYALAYAGLANAYWYASDLQFSPRDVMPKAKAAAIRALEIDDTLAEAHGGLGIFKTAYDWDWAGAEKEFRRALELNPDDATTHEFYGWYLSVMGRHDESLAEMKWAQKLDPLSLNINSNFGRTLYWARRYDESHEQLQKTLELDPNYWMTRNCLSEVYLEMRRYSEALSEIQRARQIDDNHYVLARLGLVYARMGRRAEALKVIDELKELSKRSYVSAHSVAVIYVGLGEKDVAFEWLEKAFKERAESVGWLKVDPRLDSLRDDPRFADLLRRVGLTP